jgi:hypothetical protein
MSKPTYLGRADGERHTDWTGDRATTVTYEWKMWPVWDWLFDVLGYKTEPSQYSATVLVERVSRKEAAKLAKMLLGSPMWLTIQLKPVATGEWHEVKEQQ